MRVRQPNCGRVRAARRRRREHRLAVEHELDLRRLGEVAEIHLDGLVLEADVGILVERQVLVVHPSDRRRHVGAGVDVPGPTRRGERQARGVDALDARVGRHAQRRTLREDA